MASGWSSGMEGGELVLTERDIEWADWPECAHAAVMKHLPVLHAYFCLAMLRFQEKLWHRGTSVELAWKKTEGALRVSSVAAVTMRNALWRYLLPCPGVRGEVRCQTVIEQSLRRNRWGEPGWDSLLPPLVSAWDFGVGLPAPPYGTPPELRAWRAELGHPTERILDRYDLLAALDIARRPDCLKGFPVLERYIEDNSRLWAMRVLRLSGCSRVATDALEFCRGLATVSAVAVNRAVWGGLWRNNHKDPDRDEVGLFGRRSHIEELPY